MIVTLAKVKRTTTRPLTGKWEEIWPNTRMRSSSRLLLNSHCATQAIPRLSNESIHEMLMCGTSKESNFIVKVSPKQSLSARGNGTVVGLE